MNIGDMINILHKQHGLPKAFAEDILKTMLSSIGKSLKKKQRVRLRNFGTFEMRKSRGKQRPKFKASKNMLRIFGK